jgi:hypothetical protein
MLTSGQAQVYTGLSDAYACKTVRDTFPGERMMKIARLIVASLVAIPSAFAFAQSTPPSFNGAVRAQITQEQSTYRYADRVDESQAAINDDKRTALLPHQIGEVDMGRYSLSVVRPSF